MNEREDQLCNLYILKVGIEVKGPPNSQYPAPEREDHPWHGRQVAGHVYECGTNIVGPVNLAVI